MSSWNGRRRAVCLKDGGRPDPVVSRPGVRSQRRLARPTSRHPPIGEVEPGNGSGEARLAAGRKARSPQVEYCLSTLGIPAVGDRFRHSIQVNVRSIRRRG
jgi:hypothetical protein